ncbi:MAG: hypothetical protein K2G40_02445, partial [Muribaculaceae bacterium]|nr:hypothetical protein [Muribaculaceae bacterium]
STDIKTHVVKLVDPNSTSESTMPIKRNNLYRIVLTKATKLDFDLQVLDWDDEEAEIKHTEVPLILPKNVQDSLNRQLLVYDLFTEYNVKSIDYDTKTVEFFDRHESNDEILTPDVFFSYSELQKKGLLEKDVVFTNGKDSYRIPTAGEVSLLVGSRLDFNVYPEYDGLPFISFDTSNRRYTTLNIEESIYLKNANNNLPDTSRDISEECEYGFSGLSQLKRGRQNLSVTYTDVILQNGEASPEYTDDETVGNIKKYNLAPVYGIRFKGTKQYAAYKWQNIYINNNIRDRGMSIRIKALPQNSNITIDDIVDNCSFWNDNFIEIIIPFSGYCPIRANAYPITRCKTQQASFITTTSYDASYYKRILFEFNATSVTTGGKSSRNTLRLVKVKKAENTAE